MDHDWTALGVALKDAREGLGLTQEEVGTRLGVGRSTVQGIERGDKRTKVSPTMRSYARLVGWTERSIDRVLAGGAPSPADRASGPTPRVPADMPLTETAALAALPLRIRAELDDAGPLVDTDVIPLGDDARMVVVVKGRPDATPEEIRAALKAWRQAQPHLEELSRGADDEPPDAATGA
ncbi:MAG: helix-turn-helix domain-containing protein [Nocardiopsaceae bacterium]|nr:helix-turn-helix domain-containing protein [Nocardiopsaceae bacterium]